MKMKNSLVLVASAMLACSATVTANPNCANLPGMMLKIQKYSIDLNDKMPVCITVPGEFKIKINNPPGGGLTVGGGDVTVRQKADPENATVLISGDNQSPVNKITVKVEAVAGETVSDGDEFEFWIDVKGVGKLDPRIRVVPSNQLMELRDAAIADTLDSFGLTVDEYEKLQLRAD
ncbi:MAG: hypothetical protein HKP05_01025 [Woeseiaceae bacterium]|nr:hypothetical protein [Gammaproteobacteria bacterium]NNK24207.1 hypothetical protein [Woeseiaceae bacterium]